MGVIQRGTRLKSELMTGMRNQAALERNRNDTNKRLKDERKHNMIGNTVSGGVTGAMVGGPIGAVVGAGFGFMTSLF